MLNNKKVSVLFVCMGNICRSPTAEGVARGMAQRKGFSGRFKFDSAGTHGYHCGNPPDPRARQAAAKRGYDLEALRARQVSEVDFIRFDLILAMDRDNLDALHRACPQEYRSKLALLGDYSAPGAGLEVPDPYYGGAEGFERVLDLVEDAVGRMIAQVCGKR